MDLPDDRRVLEYLYPRLRRFAAVVSPSDADPDEVVREAMALRTADGHVGVIDTAAALRRSILDLQPDGEARAVLYLADVEGWSYTAIAELLDVTEHDARARRRTAAAAPDALSAEELDRLADRGTPAGAESVVARALDPDAPRAAPVPAARDAHPPAQSLFSAANRPKTATQREDDVAPARPHRRWPRRVLIGMNVFVALCILMAGSGYAYMKWRFGQIDTVKLPFGILAPDEPKDEGPKIPMNVLLVGSDTRANLEGADCKRNCRDEQGRLVTGQRSDTIMILHADPGAKRGAILSIPRDLWVRVAGTTRNNRINTAFEKGPAQLIQTIKDNLGIPIHHYVEIDFVGFRSMVNAVGGVPIYVPAPARDRYSDLRIATPGCITLNGDQALAWVRSRHYQYFEAGRWRSDPSSDLGRILRQQDFIRRLMKRAISKGIRNPFTLNRMVEIGTENVTIDDAMSSKDILALGKRFRSLDPTSVQMYTLPTTQARIGGAAVLRVKEPDAQQVIAEFTGANPQPAEGERPPTNIPPSTVRVRILNGSGIGGLAGKTAQQLAAAGFQSAGTGDADSFGYRRTVIRYGTGQRDKALLLRSYLTAGADIKEDRTLTTDTVLVVGRDFKSVQKPPPAGAATTAPPAPAATTPTTAASPVPVPKGAPPQPQC